MRKKHITIFSDLSNETFQKLVYEASKRGYTPIQFTNKILKIIIEQDMLKAVLDEEEDRVSIKATPD
jgi:hypothetical protein